MEQHLCQIYIPGTTGLIPPRAFYRIGLNGRYRARVVGISFNDDTGEGDHRLIQLQSDCFRITSGSYPSTLIFGNKANHGQATPGGDYPFYLEVMGGGIDLMLTSSIEYDNGGNNKFFFCILTLVVEKVE
jgi:hypothetical protein